jgi:hypothetical protein
MSYSTCLQHTLVSYSHQLQHSTTALIRYSTCLHSTQLQHSSDTALAYSTHLQYSPIFSTPLQHSSAAPAYLPFSCSCVGLGHSPLQPLAAETFIPRGPNGRILGMGLCLQWEIIYQNMKKHTRTTNEHKKTQTHKLHKTTKSTRKHKPANTKKSQFSQTTN